MIIDYVIPYVNPADKEWQNTWERMCLKEGKKINKNSNRYRDYGTLKYVFRGIATNLPFINRLHFIVERPSQVPDWVNRDTVNIVYHEQIIDKDCLPTYNSGTIEMYMYRIPGLAEHFLYSNDDIYTINKTVESDWFDENGNPKIYLKTVKYAPSNVMYRHMLKGGEDLVRNELNLPIRERELFMSDHSINAMKRSVWETMWAHNAEKIKKSCSPFRSAKNFTQEISNYYNYLSGQYSAHTRVNKYCDFKNKTITDIRVLLSSKTIQNICINDNGCNAFTLMKQTMIKSLNQRFPNKCKYEK